MNNYPFHLVDYSPWPLTGSIWTMTFVSGMLLMFHKINYTLLLLGVMVLLLTMLQWWRDITREGTFQGLHTFTVIMGLKIGMILFIVSEIFCFVSFFWVFFHSSLSPVMEVGMTWPPIGINTFNPMQIPLLNTMILLCSGISITWSHHSMMSGKHFECLMSMLLTIFFSNMFYFITFITTFILVCSLRQMNCHFSKMHHFGFETAAWYWHFVDVVWLFLYIYIYWWGACNNPQFSPQKYVYCKLNILKCN